jgi:hypothetical protein
MIQPLLVTALQPSSTAALHALSEVNKPAVQCLGLAVLDVTVELQSQKQGLLKARNHALCRGCEHFIALRF